MTDLTQAGPQVQPWLLVSHFRRFVKWPLGGVLAKLCASGKEREGADGFQKLRHTERQDRDTKGRKEARVPGQVRGVLGRDSSSWQGTADFLGIHDKRPMMTAVGHQRCQVLEREHVLASPSLPPPIYTLFKEIKSIQTTQ